MHSHDMAHQFTRRGFLTGLAAAGGAAALAAGESAPVRPSARAPIKAFCIDFNWDKGKAAEPGTYAKADPAAHVRWYEELGANTIQTFCVSYNGYAWYPSEVAPVTPGLAHPNFLGDMVELGHKAGMRVMGYFTLGANPYWEARHAALVHGDTSDYIKIPMTLEYLDYFCRTIEDTLKKTAVDGFMIDWVRPTQHRLFLDCEKEMYRQLMGEPFPTAGAPSAEAALEFDRRAIDRAWRHIRWAVRATRPALIWTNHPFVEQERALWTNHRLLKEVDWVLNESPDTRWLAWLRAQVGKETTIVQNLCGWADHDAGVWQSVDTGAFGLYGFAQADPTTTMPSAAVPANLKNIEIIRTAYHRL